MLGVKHFTPIKRVIYLTGSAGGGYFSFSSSVTHSTKIQIEQAIVLGPVDTNS